MKLLTLNAGSYCNDKSENEMANLCEIIAGSDYDVIALQEINQSINAPEVSLSELDNYIPCQDRVPIKEDNYLYQIVKALSMSGQTWYWSWLPVHVGWGKYDEGVAILTKHPIIKTNAFYVSESTDYTLTKTRMALGILADFTGRKQWFYSVHFEKWDHPEEPFERQWDRFMERSGNVAAPIFVMGDFNNDANAIGEGKEYILKTSNFFDTYDKAEFKDDGYTVTDYIAGWENMDHPKDMRIDYILANTDEPILSCHVVFNGKQYPVVSDHFGLEITVGDKNEHYTHKGERMPEFSSEKNVAPPSPIVRGGSLIIDDQRFRTFLNHQNNLLELLDMLVDIFDLK